MEMPGKMKLVLWGVLATVGAFLVTGAVISAFSKNKAQGEVQVRIINDTPARVGFALCHDLECTTIDSIETIDRGEAHDQAFGPEDRERFAIEAGRGFDRQSSPVAGKPYRCTQLVTSAVVEESYNLSTLTPCDS